jgi:hypothetical protein
MASAPGQSALPRLALLDARRRRLYRSNQRSGSIINEELALFCSTSTCSTGLRAATAAYSSSETACLSGWPLLVDRLLHCRLRDLEGSPAKPAYVFADRFVRPLFAGQEVASWFSGTFGDDRPKVLGITLVGNRSLSFRAALKRLANI